MPQVAAFVCPSDSEIGQTRRVCKVESWASAAANHDFSRSPRRPAWSSSASRSNSAGQLQRSRSDGAWSDSGTIRAKTNIIPVRQTPLRARHLGAERRGISRVAETPPVFVNVPVTFQLQEKFRLNVNGGWMYDNVANVNYLTWGARL